MPDEITYERFGRNFVDRIVTPERVAAAVRAATGDLTVRPVTLGPLRAVRATPTVALRDVEARRIDDGPPLRYAARIVLDLDLRIDLAAVPHHYRGTVAIDLALTVRTVDPLILRIDVDRPELDDATVELQARDIRSRIVGEVGNVTDEVRRMVLRLVRRFLSAPGAEEHRSIDVLAIVDRTWRPGAKQA